MVRFASAAMPSPPALDWIMDPSVVRAWLASAATGAKLPYGGGSRIVHGETQQLLRAAADAGTVHLFQPRNPDGGFDFIAIKRVPPLPQLPASPRVQAVTDHALSVIYRRLKRAADSGERCPTDAMLGALTGLRVPQVKWRLHKLRDAGKIATRAQPIPGDPHFRIVTIISTGRETAGPACSLGGRR